MARITDRRVKRVAKALHDDGVVIDRFRYAILAVDALADDVPALVGRKEAAAILGVHPNNIGKVAGLPAPLQDEGIRGMDVAATPLYRRSAIEQLAAERHERANPVGAP